MIPNIFHFINIGPREFNMMHFLAIYTAKQLNNPDAIYVYVDHEQQNNIYWNILKDLGVNFTFIEAPTEHKGVKLDTYQYKADIIRMEKLIEHGGIYMDLDVLSLKSLSKFRQYKVVLGSEKSNDPESYDINDFASITNAIIMCEPDNKYIKDWYDQIGENLVDKPWAYHAVCLPKDILISGTYDVHLEKTNTFMPFCFRNPYVWSENNMLPDDAHTIHLWETIWNKEYISKLNIGYFKKNTVFAQLFRDYISIFDDYVSVIRNMIRIETNVEKRDMYYDMLRHILLGKK